MRVYPKDDLGERGCSLCGIGSVAGTAVSFGLTPPSWRVQQIGDHPNVVRLIESFAHGSGVALVFECGSSGLASGEGEGAIGRGGAL
jgi:hypothetical protein